MCVHDWVAHTHAPTEGGECMHSLYWSGSCARDMRRLLYFLTISPFIAILHWRLRSRTGALIITCLARLHHLVSDSTGVFADNFSAIADFKIRWIYLNNLSFTPNFVLVCPVVYNLRFSLPTLPKSHNNIVAIRFHFSFINISCIWVRFSQTDISWQISGCSLGLLKVVIQIGLCCEWII